MLSKLAPALIFGALLMVPFALTAHVGATGVVKERMDLMEVQKNAMRVLGAMAKGKAPFDAPKAAAAAEEIEVTATEITGLFPEGSLKHPSEATAEIWTQWDKFTADADTLEKAAAALKAALEGDAAEWQGKFKQVIDACKTCHKTFRKEDKKT
ncbi:MAG: cytochrome c [Pseudomonadota bacterium]